MKSVCAEEASINVPSRIVKPETHIPCELQTAVNMREICETYTKMQNDFCEH